MKMERERYLLFYSFNGERDPSNLEKREELEDHGERKKLLRRRVFLAATKPCSTNHILRKEN